MKDFAFLLLVSLLLIPVRSSGQDLAPIGSPFSSGVPQGQGSFGFHGGGFMSNAQESSPSQESQSWKEQVAPTGPIGLSEQTESSGVTEPPEERTPSSQTGTLSMGENETLPVQRGIGER